MTIPEWFDVDGAAADDPHRKVHLARYEWAASMLYRHGETTSRIANAACASNYGADVLKSAGALHVTGFDRSVEAATVAKVRGRVPIVLCDLENERLRGFDTLVTIETVEHLTEPWLWLANLDKGVRTLVLSTPIVPTMHINRWHMHDWDKAEVVQRLTGMGWDIEEQDTLPDPSPSLGPEVYWLGFMRRKAG